MATTVDSAVSALGAELKQKLAQPVVTGDPEEQLRTPLDTFLRAAAGALGFTDVNVIGEVKMADISSRPDFAVTIGAKQVAAISGVCPRTGRCSGWLARVRRRGDKGPVAHPED